MSFFGTVNLTLNLGGGNGNVNDSGNGMRLIDDTMNNQQIPQPRPNATVNHTGDQSILLNNQFNVVPNQTTVANQNNILPVENVGGQLGRRISETKTTYHTSNGMQVHTVVNYVPLANQPSIQFGSFNNGASSFSSGSSGLANTNLVSALPTRDRVNNSFMSLLRAQIEGKNTGSPQPLNSVHGKERMTAISTTNGFSSLLQNQMVSRNMDQPRPLNIVHGKEPSTEVSASSFSSLLQSQNATRNMDPQPQLQPINTPRDKELSSDVSTIGTVAESPATNQARLFRKLLPEDGVIQFARRARGSEKNPLPMYARLLEKNLAPVTEKEISTKTYEELFQENQEKIVYNENGVVECSPISFRLPGHVSNQETTPYPTGSSFKNGKSEGQSKTKRVCKRKTMEQKEGDEPKVIKEHGPYFCPYCNEEFKKSPYLACHIKVIHFIHETPEEKAFRRSMKNKKKRVTVSENPNGGVTIMHTYEKSDGTPITTVATMTKIVQGASSSTAGTKGKKVAKEDEPVFGNVMGHHADAILISGSESD